MSQLQAIPSEIALKALELSQARALLQVELKANGARVTGGDGGEEGRDAGLGDRSSIGSGRRFARLESHLSSSSTSYLVSSSLVRACLFYESAINLAFSIFELSLENAKETDNRKNADGKLRVSPSSPSTASREVMLEFLEGNIGAFGRLIHFKNSLSTYLAEARAKVDLSNPERARTRLFGEITEMETRVKEACSLVEAFLFPRRNRLVAP